MSCLLGQESGPGISRRLDGSLATQRSGRLGKLLPNKLRRRLLTATTRLAVDGLKNSDTRPIGVRYGQPVGFYENGLLATFVTDSSKVFLHVDSIHPMAIGRDWS